MWPGSHLRDPLDALMCLEDFASNEADVDAYMVELRDGLEREDSTDGIMEQVSSIEHTVFSSEIKKPELKPLPVNLRYAFLDSNEMHPVIVSAYLSDVQLAALLVVLRKHKKAIGYNLDDLKGISPEFCMHRIYLEENSKSAKQGQRRLHPNLHEVVTKEVMKLLDACIIYPIALSEWVSPIQVVSKKRRTTVVTNKRNELMPTRIVMGWQICIDYRKLNTATKKYHYPLPLMDQMLERLACHKYFCFLDDYSGFFQIPIHPNDQDMTAFTCHAGTYAYRRIPFGLCNAPATFQRCMNRIFNQFIESIMEAFMDDFSVYGHVFDNFLTNLDKVLERCEQVDLVLNWEKCHFMVTKGVILGHLVSERGIQVDKAKVEVIERLPPPVNIKEVRNFLGHAGFYRRFIKDFSKIAKPLTQLLLKDTPFVFTDECLSAFEQLN